MGKQRVRCPRDDRVARLPTMIHLLSRTTWIMAVLSRDVSGVPPPYKIRDGQRIPMVRAWNEISATTWCGPTTHRLVRRVFQPPLHHPPECLREPTAAALSGVGQSFSSL